MYALAKLYVDPASAWHGDEEIGRVLHGGLAYWYTKKPSSLNWWHGEIGVPKKLAAILLMIRGELSARELEQGLRIIERARFGRTGQNKVWLAGNNLMRGLLTDDEGLVAEARRQIGEEIVITDGEGIQSDWSFHQHGPPDSVRGTTGWPMPRGFRSGSGFWTEHPICFRMNSALSSSVSCGRASAGVSGGA